MKFLTKKNQYQHKPLPYYTLAQTEEDKQFYFDNEGIFNFWNTYLVVHIGNQHIVHVNRSGKKIPEHQTHVLKKDEKKIINQIDIWNQYKQIFKDFPECLKEDWMEDTNEK